MNDLKKEKLISFRKKNFGNWELGRVWFFLMGAPLFIILFWFNLRLIGITSRIWHSFMIGFIGVFFLLIVIYLALEYMYRFPLAQVAISILLIVLSLFLIIMFIFARAQAFRILFGLAIYEDTLAVIQIVYLLKKLIKQMKVAGRGATREDQINLAIPRKNLKAFIISGIKIIGRDLKSELMEIFRIFKLKKRYLRSIKFNIFIVSLFLGIILAPKLVINDKPMVFSISDEQAESYNLVVYFPDYNQIDSQIVSIFKEVNATLSFPLTINRFFEGDMQGEIAANKVKLLNQNNVSVEIWPLFESNNGSYPSISEIKDWPYLYNMFQEWIVRNNISVQYLLWDIESGGEFADAPSFNNLSPFLKWLAYSSYEPLRVNSIKEQWPNALEVIHNISDRARNDGHIMITTTFTLIQDVFDGDPDLQQFYGLPVWDAGDAFTYISMMAYRGCEWGGEPQPSSMIYEFVHMSAISQPGTIAVCLGCINYTPYPEIKDVKQDVLLALAAGANTVRLFQANSWINGVGTWQNSNGNWIYGGIAHGVDNSTTGGLKQLLEACRTGGSVEFTPNRNIRYSILNSILKDLTYNLMKF
ncbi:MAG: hypothetical protein ACTSU2_13875 [Promethearchaeota archaeon]